MSSKPMALPWPRRSKALPGPQEVGSNRSVRRIGAQAAVDEICHRDERPGRPESSCAGDERVELGVQRFRAAVRGSVVEGVPDQGLEAAERFRQFREFRDPGAAGPGDDAGEQGLPVVSLDAERFAELLFDQVALERYSKPHVIEKKKSARAASNASW
jgi:hypothetical protein